MKRNWPGKAEILDQNPVPVPICQPKSLHGLTCEWTGVSLATDRWPTAWAMVTYGHSGYRAHFTQTTSLLVTAWSLNLHTREIAECRKGRLNYSRTVKFGFRKRKSETRCRCAPVPGFIMTPVPPLNSFLYLREATSNPVEVKFGA